MLDEDGHEEEARGGAQECTFAESNYVLFCDGGGDYVGDAEPGGVDLGGGGLAVD